MGYDRLIKLSKKIKAESIVEGNIKISTEDIEARAGEIKEYFVKKMSKLSESEDFESAAKMKQDIDFIEDRVGLISEMGKPEITTEEYFKLFYIP
jgi:excinuclease UvrABC nuclease subunit